MKISWQMQIVAGVLVAIAAYFFGNLNSGIFLSKKYKQKDIRDCGSGNPGTMNMIRTYGKKLGAMTLVLDVAKGVVPSVLGWLFMGDGEFLMLGTDRSGLYLGGICAVIGTIYPALMRFRGGKGVATIIGFCLTAQPVWTVCSFAVGVALLFLVHIGSLTSFVIMSAPLVAEGLYAANGPSGVTGVVLIALIFALTLFAHRGNLVKMFTGREGKVILIKPKTQKPIPDRSIVFDNMIVAE